jgi:hypothetical protein
VGSRNWAKNQGIRIASKLYGFQLLPFCSLMELFYIWEKMGCGSSSQHFVQGGWGKNNGTYMKVSGNLSISKSKGMNEKIVETFKGLPNRKSCRLTFNDAQLTVDQNITKGSPPKIIHRNELKGYRFGIRWIEFEITYGREFCIFLREGAHNEIKIGIKSFLRRQLEFKGQCYFEILESLWDFYFEQIADEYIARQRNGEDFSIEEVRFSKDHISIPVSGSLKNKRVEIPWYRVGTSNFQTYFAIYDKEDAVNVNRGFSYLEDWNTGILYSVVRDILEEKNSLVE